MLKVIFFLLKVYVCLKLRCRTNDTRICPKMRYLGIVYNKQANCHSHRVVKAVHSICCLLRFCPHTHTNHFMSYISCPLAILIPLELLKCHLESRKAFENCHVDKVPMETNFLDIHVFNIAACNFVWILVEKKSCNNNLGIIYTFLKDYKNIHLMCCVAHAIE